MPRVKHARAAFRTFAERLFAGEIDGAAACAVRVLVMAEIKFRLELRRPS